MGDANLLPCPFCGYTGASVTRNTVAGDFVVCVGCGARGPNASTEEGAIAGWNRRRDLGELVNAAWRKANLLGIELAEERVISEARERANVAARERIAELERQVASAVMTDGEAEAEARASEATRLLERSIERRILERSIERRTQLEEAMTDVVESGITRNRVNWARTYLSRILDGMSREEALRLDADEAPRGNVDQAPPAPDREHIAEPEERVTMTGRAPKLVVTDAETGRDVHVPGLNAPAPLEGPMLVMVPVDRKGPPV